MPYVAGAEPFHQEGGPVGVLLCHGFTGSPVSLRPWAEFLAGHGLTVALPTLPGHGTRWQEMQLTTWDDWYDALEKAFTDLAGRCEQVFVFGLSMGGALALQLAHRHPDRVAGLVLVNPAVVLDDKRLAALPMVKHLVPALKGISNDIKKPGVNEGAYDRMPLRALHSFNRGLRSLRAGLGQIEAPLLIFRSPEDHVVSPASVRHLLAAVASTDVEERLCLDSYHVAVLDHDAERIYTGSLEFVRKHGGEFDAGAAPTPDQAAITPEG